MSSDTSATFTLPAGTAVCALSAAFACLVLSSSTLVMEVNTAPAATPAAATPATPATFFTRELRLLSWLVSCSSFTVSSMIWVCSSTNWVCSSFAFMSIMFFGLHLFFCLRLQNYIKLLPAASVFEFTVSTGDFNPPNSRFT